MKTGLIGNPVSHSLSPVIHQYWLDKYNIDGVYQAVKMTAEELAEGVEGLINQGYRGFNVTVPHKQAIISYCDYINDAARSIGAVNTVVITGGKLDGRNTDASGFLENLYESAPEIKISQTPALVFGAGGAARAVVYALKQAGAPEIIISNRTKTRAQALAGEFGAKVVDWSDKDPAARNSRLVVNTTVLGMAGYPDLDFNVGLLPKGSYVYDIVYNPLQTGLLREAGRAGHNAIDGLGMLLHQAAPAFEAWYGVRPAVTKELRNRLLEALS